MSYLLFLTLAITPSMGMNFKKDKVKFEPRIYFTSFDTNGQYIQKSSEQKEEKQKMPKRPMIFSTKTYTEAQKEAQKKRSLKYAIAQEKEEKEEKAKKKIIEIADKKSDDLKKQLFDGLKELKKHKERQKKENAIEGVKNLASGLYTNHKEFMLSNIPF